MDLLSLKRSLWAMRGPSGGRQGDAGDGSGTGMGGGFGGYGGGGGSSSSEGTNPGQGLSAGSSGLGLGAGYGYGASSAGGYSLGSGLGKGEGFGTSIGGGGLGMSSGSNDGGIGGDLGRSLSGVTGDLGLSAEQRGSFSTAIAKADAKTKAALAGFVNVMASLAVPAVGVANMISKAIAGETLGSVVAGAVATGSISAALGERVKGGFAKEGFDMGARVDSGFRGDAGRDSSSHPQQTNGALANKSATAADPLADLFATFMPGGPGAATSEFKEPTYDADPSGLVAKYKSEYLPYNQKMMSEVDRYGSAEYQQQMRDQAMADVQQQSDRQYEIARRNMGRMGVNPSDGRFMAMNNQSALAVASAKVAAATASDKSLRDTYQKGLASINTMGQDVAKLGFDASKTKSTWDMGVMDSRLKHTSQQQGNAYNWGALSNQRYGIDKGVFNNTTNANAASERQKDSDKSTLWGVGLQYGLDYLTS